MGARIVLSDDEEEGQGEYEKDDFIVDEDEEEQHVKENNEEVNARKNKRKKRDIGEIYDDGDHYELLHEANDMSIQHPKSGKKTFRRLKKVVSHVDVDVDMEEQTRLLDIDNLEEDDCKGKMELKCSLFADDEGNLEKDDEVQDTDVAERLQNENTVQEAKWIYGQVFGSSAILMRTELQHIAKLDRDEVVKEIDNVLQMLHAKKFEIPFIGMYRKEMCLNLLRDPERGLEEIEDKERKAGLNQYKALWAIQSWDRKWFLLQRRKMALKTLYDKRAGEAASSDPSKWKLLETIFQCLTDAESERTVDDIDAKFNLHFPPDEVDVEGQFKRLKHKSLYSICHKAGLGAVSRKFGITSEQLGKNLLAMHKMHEVEDASTPEDVAAECLAGEFGDPLSVLKGARHMAAIEISCEPAVKEYVRGIYMKHTVVTTRPTSNGDSVIDSWHQYAGIKWLLNKPLNMFDDAQWLLIQKAEEDKLLQVTIGLPTEVIDETLIAEFEAQYLSDGVSRAAQLWNEQRKLILRDALCSYILPSMEREARMVLSAVANRWLVWEYGMQVWNKVAVAPFRQPNVDNSNQSDEDAALRVMACCWGPGNPPTTFVMLNKFGEVLDVLSAGFLSTRSRSAVAQQRKQNDQQRLSKFIFDHQPHVVVLGAACFSCKHLKDDICEVILRIIEEHPCELPEGVDVIKVVYADEALARLYENSHISEEQLPGRQGIVRRAVALGRCLQNPLAMFATLCGPGREILSLKLHSLEHFLSLDERYRAVKQVMITITNQVGVDVNLAASHEWMFAPLQFISGLGPRKASLLQRAISSAGSIYSRKELIKVGAMKLCVFKNAAGFIRVRRSGQAESGNHVMDPLDDSRIHPESYELARKMTEDVCCADKMHDIADVDIQEMVVEHVKNNIRLLKDLDIDKYVRSMEQQTHTKKHQTYADIWLELQHGFQDWRIPYREPSEDEEFYLLTGENDQTLAEGRVVQATVWKIQEYRVLCTLASGMKGFIMKEELSDAIDIDPAEKITEGSILTCRVKGIEKAKYMVDLTCKVSELRGDKWQGGQKDPYYAKDECSLHGEQDKVCKEKELAKKFFKPRMIVHPCFQNISDDEAILALSDKDAGEIIIRPSSRGPSYLTLSLKVYDGVYVHKDIVESGKDLRDFTSFLGLGKTLSIGEDTFGGLDEVIDRYVVPLVSNLKAMLAYRNFRRGTTAEVDDALQKEKLENPTGILYYFCVSHEYPGVFILCYIRNTNTHHEYVGLYPKGFKFRKRMFDDLDTLVDYFQTHIDDVLWDSLPSIKSVTEMVPKKSPCHGASGHAGGSRGSGYGGSATYSGAGDGGWNTNWERSSTLGSRSAANEHNHYTANDGHPSGLARPHGYGRGRGRGRDRGGRGGWNEGRGGRFGRGRGKWDGVVGLAQVRMIVGVQG